MKKLILFLLTIFMHLTYCAQQNEPTGSKRKPELDFEKNRAQKRQKTEQEADETENLRELLNNLIKNRDDSPAHLNTLIEEIKETLRKTGVDVNLVLPYFYEKFHDTPLYAIAGYKQLNSLAKWLIEQGADSTKFYNLSSPSPSPFARAAYYNNHDLVNFMISQGADFAKPDFLYNLSQYVRIRISDDPSIYKNTMKTVLINGANFKEESFQKHLKDNNLNKKYFDEVVHEIVKEYRQKLNSHANNIKLAIASTGLILPDLAGIVAQYANYSDEQIMDNIMQIRYELGELSEIQKAKFVQSQQNQQDRPAAAAAIHPAQQAAASTDIAPMQQ